MTVAQATLNAKLQAVSKAALTCQDYQSKACFAAGTKLWTPQGYRAIEEIRAGDLVYSRDEWDAGGDVSAKVVEEVLERFAGVLNLHVGGEVISTTGEHPFFAYGRGWVPGPA